mmetsp:Transcript_119212/g.254358  ORF Transcript_119212/g.254358 Transcript_119212/m.254358 type:complete len:261 (-) Transcript_119212:34-816(-)
MQSIPDASSWSAGSSVCLSRSTATSQSTSSRTSTHTASISRSLPWATNRGMSGSSSLVFTIPGALSTILSAMACTRRLTQASRILFSSAFNFTARSLALTATFKPACAASRAFAAEAWPTSAAMPAALPAASFATGAAMLAAPAALLARSVATGAAISLARWAPAAAWEAHPAALAAMPPAVLPEALALLPAAGTSISTASALASGSLSAPTTSGAGATRDLFPSPAALDAAPAAELAALLAPAASWLAELNIAGAPSRS